MLAGVCASCVSVVLVKQMAMGRRRSSMTIFFRGKSAELQEYMLTTELQVRETPEFKHGGWRRLILMGNNRTRCNYSLITP